MGVPRYRILPQTRPHQAGQAQQSLAHYTTILMFLLPGLILFTLILILPMAQSASYSLYDWNGLGPLDEYVGLENYQRLFNHAPFRTAVLNTFIIMALSLTVQLSLAMVLALLLRRNDLPGKGLFRAVFFVPYIFSDVITALIFSYVMHPRDGLLNVIGQFFIVGFENQLWLANRETALYAVFAVLTWKYFGVPMVLYMAALQDIPEELEEAARIDGASELTVLTRVTLPLLGPVIRLTAFLVIVGSIQQFVMVWLLTQGGPAGATEVMGTYLYKYGMQRISFGYGSAIAVVLFAITLVFSVGYQRLVMRRDFANE